MMETGKIMFWNKVKITLPTVGMISIITLLVMCAIVAQDAIQDIVWKYIVTGSISIMATYLSWLSITSFIKYEYCHLRIESEFARWLIVIILILLCNPITILFLFLYGAAQGM